MQIYEYQRIWGSRSVFAKKDRTTQKPKRTSIYEVKQKLLNNNSSNAQK